MNEDAAPDEIGRALINIILWGGRKGEIRAVAREAKTALAAREGRIQQLSRAIDATIRCYAPSDDWRDGLPPY